MISDQVDACLQPVRPRAQRVFPHYQMPCGFERSLRESPKEWSDANLVDDPIKMIVPQSQSPLQLHQPEERDLFRPTPNLIRPVALKVARPIPQTAVEQFYDEAYNQGIRAEEVHAAAMLAEDWHRKWTQQDEEGHTMPEAESDFAVVDDVRTRGRTGLSLISSDNFGFNPLDRGVGAKNPSPDDVNEDIFCDRKRLRLVVSRISSSPPKESENSSSLINVQCDFGEPPSSKRRVIGSADNTHDLSGVPEMMPVGVLKPVALRVQRPKGIDVKARADGFDSRATIFADLPADILKDRLARDSSMSPITLPSWSSCSGNQNRPVLIVDDEAGQDELIIPHVESPQTKLLYLGRSSEIESARCGVLCRLAVTGGDVVQDRGFLDHLNVLKDHYQRTGADTRFLSDGCVTSEGMWLTLTHPTFFGNLGTNDNGDPMYTLGRMSFDMFSPTRLVCSLQGNFNSVHKVADSDRSAMFHAVPKALQDEVKSGSTVLRTYDIVTALTVEPHLPAWPNAPNKDVRRPIRAIMTTKGYTLPDPAMPNRHSVWITGGRIEPNNDVADQSEWLLQFEKNPPKHGIGEQAKLLAVKLLMGATLPTSMNEDGSLEYSFQRPLGGHGLAYVDTLYVDESLRIVQGHRGTIFVFSRLPDVKPQ